MGATMNEDRWGVISASLDVASVATTTSAEQDFTIEGLKAGDVVFCCKPSESAGLGIVNARVKSAGVLSITFMNTTAGAINPAAETYLIFWFRPEKTTTRANP